MEQNRKELVQKFIAKLKDEIQELRNHYNRLVEDNRDIEKFYWLYLIKLDVVEDAFCNEEFYNKINSYGNYTISDHTLNMLCIRDFNTAEDLMNSIYFSTPFINQKEFEFNLLTVYERGILRDRLEE